MKIKSKEDLLTLRKEYEASIRLRETGFSNKDQIEVLIGMATCGIASGAKETFDELNRLIQLKNLTNVKLVQVGCLGYCIKEPTIQVCKPGQKPVLYGFITEDKADVFLEKTILSDEGMPKNQVIMSYNKVVD